MKFSIIACVILAGFLICAVGYAQDDTFSVKLTQNTKTVYDLLKDEKEKELEIGLAETIEARRAEYVKNYFLYYGIELKASSLSDESKITATAISAATTPVQSIFAIPKSAQEGGVDANIIDWSPSQAFSSGSNASITGYNVYRRELGVTSWTLVSDNGSKFRYVDTNIDSTKAYQYKIMPYDNQGTEGTERLTHISANYSSAYDGMKSENVLILVNSDELGFVNIGEAIEGSIDANGKLNPITESELRVYLGYSDSDPGFLTDDGDGTAHNATWHILKNTATGEINVPLGVYYGIRRNVPKENIVFLDHIPSGERTMMSIEDFQTYVVQPIKNHIISNGLASKIESIASVYRFPLVATPAVAFINDPGIVSWDDELNIRLWQALGEDYKDMPERFRSTHRFSRELGDAGYLVTSIDAQDIATTRRMIDDAIWAEETYHFDDSEWRAQSDLMAFVDWKGPYTMGDDWFKEAASILSNSDLFGAQGDNWDMAPDLNQIISLYDQDGDGRLDNTFLYTGWYNYYKYQDWFEWARGSIGWNLDSGSGYSFRNWIDQGNVYGNAWGANIINRGAAASLGAVYEPYLGLHTRPAEFMHYLLNGYTFAEAGYLSSAVHGLTYADSTSWMYAFNGDPLYNPFGLSSGLRMYQVSINGRTVNRLVLSSGYPDRSDEDNMDLKLNYYMGYQGEVYRDYDLDGNLLDEVLPNGLKIYYFADGRALFYDITGYAFLGGAIKPDFWLYSADGDLEYYRKFPLGYQKGSADIDYDNFIDSRDADLNEEIYSFAIQYMDCLPDEVRSLLDKNGDGLINQADLDIQRQFIQYHSAGNYLNRLEAEIAARQDGGASFYDSNFDFNDDGIIDELDRQVAGDMYTLPEAQFRLTFAKLLTAARSALNTSSGSARFIEIFDADGSGTIDRSDYARLRSFLTQGWADFFLMHNQIILNITNEIRSRMGSASSSPGGYDVIFDMDNNGNITGTDSTKFGNVNILTGNSFQLALDKILTGVRQRLGAHTGDADFISAFDADSDGDIDESDYSQVGEALTEGRFNSKVTAYFPSSTKKYEEEFYENGFVWQKTIQYYEDGATMRYQWVVDAHPGVAGDDIFYEYNNSGRLIRINKDNGQYKTLGYFGSTNYKSAMREYDSYDNLLATYTCFNDIDNRIESKTLVIADTFGNTYYHYMNEAFFDSGTPSDPTDDYGRVNKQVVSVVDEDGAIGYEYEYFTDTNKISIKRCYQIANYSDPSNPVFTTLLASYEYNLSGDIVTKVSYRDGKWHKESNFTAILGDGKIHAQRDEIYSDMALTTFVELDVMSFYTTGKLAQIYIFDENGKIMERRDYSDETGDSKDPHAPLVEYKDGKIASLTTFGNDGKPADKYTFDENGKIVEIVHYGSPTIFGNDVNGDGKIDESDIEAVRSCTGAVIGNPLYNENADLNHDGRITGTDVVLLRKFVNKYKGLHAPLVEFKDGKIASLTIFTADGKPADKYIFAEVDGKLVIDYTVHYGEGDSKAFKTLDTNGDLQISGDEVIKEKAPIPVPTTVVTMSKESNLDAEITLSTKKPIPSELEGRKDYEEQLYPDPQPGTQYTKPEGLPEKVIIYNSDGSIKETPVKPDLPIPEKSINPGDDKPPVTILPRLPDLSEPKEPTTGAPITITPTPPVEEPIKSPVITLPINNKVGSSISATISVVSEVNDKMAVIEASKTDLPAGVSISGEMASKENQEALPTEGKQ